MTYLMSGECVYRTAPATPGLLNMSWKKMSMGSPVVTPPLARASTFVLPNTHHILFESFLRARTSAFSGPSFEMHFANSSKPIFFLVFLC